MRRQLEYAMLEEKHSREELRTVSNDLLTEKHQLQKQLVELKSQLQFAEESESEWKEKAMESESQLRLQSRQSKLEVGLRFVF